MSAFVLPVHTELPKEIELVEQRQDVRERITAAASVQLADGSEPPLSVGMFDRSAGGLSFISPQPFREGERLEISYALPQGTKSERVEVMHCESIAAGGCRIGARIVWKL